MTDLKKRKRNTDKISMPRLHMQVWQPGTERKAFKKYFLVVKLAHCFVCKVSRKLASYYNQEILILKLEKLFLQKSGFIPGPGRQK